MVIYYFFKSDWNHLVIDLFVVFLFLFFLELFVLLDQEYFILFLFPFFFLNLCFRSAIEKKQKQMSFTKNLMRHMRYECGLPPRFPCHVCGRFFRRKDDLQRHIARIHGILDGSAALLLAGDGIIKQDE